MMFTFVLYNSIYIPISIGDFSVNKPLGQCIIDILIDVLFIVDMLLNLRTVYYDEEGQLVLQPRTIYRKYLCSHWFVIDFLAVFPFDIIVSGGWDCGTASEADEDAYTSVTKLLKALRLLRLVRFRKELDRLSGANLLRVVASLSFFVLVAHWLACIWWALGYLEYKQDERRAAGTHVLCDSTHPCSWIRRIPDDGEKLSPESSFAQQYVSSFYWSLTTLMKTPWIGPDTIAEKTVATCAIFAGAIFYASFLGTVQGSYASFNKSSSQKHDKIANLTAFMNARNIPNDLRAKMIGHTNQLAAWLPLGIVNSQVLQQLPSHLRGEVALELYADTCGSPSRMFPNVSIECAKMLVMRLQTQLVMPNQVLIAQKEVCTQLYFLVKGGLRVQTEPPSATMCTKQPPPSRDAVESPSRSPSKSWISPTDRRSSGSDRRSSTKAFPLLGFRELERPGASVGLVEPLDSTCLGLYPVWVVATKKTMLLSITQIAIAEALEAFPDDVAPLREHLSMKHKTLVESLKVEPSDDSPIAMCKAAIVKATRRTHDAKMSVSDDDKKRIAGVEELVHHSLERVMKMQKDMAALGGILKLVEEVKADRVGRIVSRSKHGGVYSPASSCGQQ